MNVKAIVAVFGLALFSGHASAQWTGCLSADGSHNFKQSNRENLSFNLKYNTAKFYVGTDLAATHNLLPSSQITEILDYKKEESGYYKHEDKELCPRNLNFKGSIQTGFRFNERNFLDFILGCAYQKKTDYPILETYRYAGEQKEEQEGIQKDSTNNAGIAFNGSIEYTHKFKSRPSSVLTVVSSARQSYAVEDNTRITAGDFYSKNKHYRTHSSINDLDSKLNLKYSDVFSFKMSELKLQAGIDGSFDNDFDLYGAETNIGGQWRDSTRYRQSYYYYAGTLEPYLNFNYSVGNFVFDVKEKVQCFNHCIKDQIDEETWESDKDYLFNIIDWQNLLSAGVSYNINDAHSVGFDYDRSIVRPDYKKLCPTLMIGGSDGEFYIGNPVLSPEITDRFGLKYIYHYKVFVTTLSFSYVDKENTAEKVLETSVGKDAFDPDVKTLYTWVNTKSQQTLGARLNMTMNAKDVVAQIWGGFNYDFYKTKSDITKEDSNFELGTRVVASLNESVELSTQLMYVSARNSAFNSKGENVLANLRISKVFQKGLELYLEGRDLVDKDKYEETWNEALTYYKCVTTRPMNRAVVLGLKYSF